MALLVRGDSDRVILPPEADCCSVRWSEVGWPGFSANLNLTVGDSTILLVESPDAAGRLQPQWVAKEADGWADSDSDASPTHRLLWRICAYCGPGWMCWTHLCEALVLDGLAATSARVSVLQTMLELMGKA